MANIQGWNGLGMTQPTGGYSCDYLQRVLFHMRINRCCCWLLFQCWQLPSAWRTAARSATTRTTPGTLDAAGAGQAGDEFLPPNKPSASPPRRRTGPGALDWIIAAGYYLYRDA
jgi:hypothetical protein